MGEPVALFSVPSAAAMSGVAVAGAADSLLLAESERLSPEPHPASSAAAPRHAVQYVQVLIVLLMWWSRRRRRDSWNAGARAARAVRWRRLRARAVRGGAHMRGRRPRARGTRAARRTAPPRRCRRPRAEGWEAGARRSPAPGR